MCTCDSKWMSECISVCVCARLTIFLWMYIFLWHILLIYNEPWHSNTNKGVLVCVHVCLCVFPTVGFSVWALSAVATDRISLRLWEEWESVCGYPLERVTYTCLLNIYYVWVCVNSRKVDPLAVPLMANRWQICKSFTCHSLLFNHCNLIFSLHGFFVSFLLLVLLW